MSLEVLQSVARAEEKAEEIRVNAQQEARELLKNTENQCAVQIASAAKEHRVMQREMIARASEVVAKKLEVEGVSSVAQRAERHEAAMRKLPEAVDFICERILNDGSC